MSTEIKNTLFRFVTMRAPELSEEEGSHSRFIYHDARLSGSEVRVFEDAITAGASSGLSKWQLMANRAATYTPKTVAEIKLFNKPLYDFGVWIARNKQTYSNAELAERASLLTTLNTEKINLLWDNLFYQVVTQKDFHAKEAIMQLLLANHVAGIKTFIAGDPEKAKIYMEAKVVLPKDMFVETDGSSSGSMSRMSSPDSPTAYRSEPGAEMVKLRQNLEAANKIEDYQTIKKELKKAEAKYWNLYNAAHDTAVKTQEEAIKTILDEHDRVVKESLSTWCSINEYDPKDPCHQPPFIPYPDLPELDFTFAQEMSLDVLKTELTASTFDNLLKFLELDYSYEAKGADPYTIGDEPDNGLTFGQTYIGLDNGIAQANQVILNNSPSQNTTVVSVGGVVVPTTNQSASAPFSFQICPSRSDATHIGFDIAITVPDTTWAIDDSSNYKITGDTMGLQPLNFVSKNGNSILLKTSQLHLFSGAATATSFEAVIRFTNGAVRTVTIPITVASSIYKSCYSVTMSDDGSSGDTVVNFVPPGFGFKQIGIADYKKVEQTTQGYVEGDVAHIENVMAREYREKATRKLLRSENTTTKSTESEKEKLSDTTTSNRFEMQSEVAKVIQEDKDVSASAGMSYDPSPKMKLTANVGMASHSSNQTSTTNAINEAREITERAMERIVTKVKEERIEKIIEEFEENNKHGFDNTKGDKHVVGVFRWVDKVFKNQVYNYGKRLMFEFMIPQPGKLHLLGMSENRTATTLVEPIDPRNYVDLPTTPAANALKLTDYAALTDAAVKHWSNVFNVELPARQDDVIHISHAFKDSSIGIDDGSYGRWSGSYSNVDFKIPENYCAVSVKGNISIGGMHAATNGKVYVCGNLVGTNASNINLTFPPTEKIRDKITVHGNFWDVKVISGSLVAKCELTPEAKTKWQQETFRAIIEAYEDALAEYNQKLAQENALGIKIKGENPGFYRQIENLILRKNCISYMIDQNPAAARTYGKDMFRPLNPATTPRTFGNHEVNVSAGLDDYSGFVKFMEQAFEWEIMSYNFYPYYWGKRDDWEQLYQYDNNDPLFRNFMQAGMARAIVTVRPGFEEAVRFYMQTGLIWNGGEVPVIEDPMFLSIVDELRAPKGVKEGKAWATRLPTALTILQASSIGLNVTKALPFDEDALSEFENPDEVPVSEGLELTDTTLGNSNRLSRLVGRINGNNHIEAKIVLKKQDGSLFDLTYCDAEGDWELAAIPAGEYELILDGNDDFDSGSYLVTEGQVSQMVTVAPDQAIEVNLSLTHL